MRAAFQLKLYQQDANSLPIGLKPTRCKQVEVFSTGLISTRCEQPLNWTYINKIRIAFQLDLYQLKCEQPLNWMHINKILKTFQFDLYQQVADSLSTGLMRIRCEHLFNWTYANKMQTSRSFLNWTYANKMQIASQWD